MPYQVQSNNVQYNNYRGVKNMNLYEIATILKKFNTDYIIINFEIYGYIPVFNAINWNYPVKKINLTNVSKKELLTILNTGFIKG